MPDGRGQVNNGKYHYIPWAHTETALLIVVSVVERKKKKKVWPYEYVNPYQVFAQDGRGGMGWMRKRAFG